MCVCVCVIERGGGERESAILLGIAVVLQPCIAEIRPPPSQKPVSWEFESCPHTPLLTHNVICHPATKALSNLLTVRQDTPALVQTVSVEILSTEEENCVRVCVFALRDLCSTATYTL